MSRYVVVKGSTSSHCCFEASVIDTAQPIAYFGKPLLVNGEQQFKTICECFEYDDAVDIVNTLNRE